MCVFAEPEIENFVMEQHAAQGMGGETRLKFFLTVSGGAVTLERLDMLIPHS